MKFTGFTCQFGSANREEDTPAAAVWQLSGARPGRWFAVACDTVPIDAPQTRLGHRSVRI